MPTLGGLACLNNNGSLFYLYHITLLKASKLSTSKAAILNKLKDSLDVPSFPDQIQFRIGVYEMEAIPSHGNSFMSETLND
jgi:hypothetical protein